MVMEYMEGGDLSRLLSVRAEVKLTVDYPSKAIQGVMLKRVGEKAVVTRAFRKAEVNDGTSSLSVTL